MFNFIMGIFAGLAVGFALEWMIDWSALNRKRKKRDGSMPRTASPESGPQSETGDAPAEDE
jgi:hypothetical protein